MVVGGATAQGAAVAQSGRGHGSGGSVQLMDDGGVAVSPSPWRCSVERAAGEGGISPRRRDGAAWGRS